MRNAAFHLAVAAALCAAAACNKNDPQNQVSTDQTYTTGEAANTAGSPEVGGTSLSSDINPVGGVLAPEVFVSTVAGSDLFEIQSGELAQTRATSPALKAFARQLVADHTKSSALLKAAAAKVSPTIAPPTSLPPDLQATLGALKMSKPQDFDSGFVDTQIQAHKKALEVLTQYAANGDSAPLKQFAVTAIPVVKMHLAKLNGMKRQ